jgi:inositol phosphorylceramide mannosyltransferase catalytic subunit
MIPLVLHQVWGHSEIPQPYADWHARWRQLHPLWQHQLYDDSRIRRIIVERAPQWLNLFDQLPRKIQRYDLFRYLIIFLEGGVYADMDMKPYRPSDTLLHGQECVFCIEYHVGRRRQARMGYKRPWQIANCIFAATPRHPFLGAILDRIAVIARLPIVRDEDIEAVTGPIMVTRLAFELTAKERGSITILPQLTWTAPRVLRFIGPLATRIYATHASAGVWRTHAAPRLPIRELLDLTPHFAMFGRMVPSLPEV